LAALAAVGTAALVIAFAIGLEPAVSFSDNWLLTGAATAVTATAIGSALLGLVALTARHDRSWVVLAATIAGIVLSALFLQQVAEGLGWLSA
jgi:predicted transcriptional regulator